MNTSQSKIGYARTSTTDQNLDSQMTALKAAGCGMVRAEQKSGASLDRRPELKTILDFIHPGETLVVTRIDRLARSLSDLQTIVCTFEGKRCSFGCDGATGGHIHRRRQGLLRHVGRVRGIRNQLAPRAPGRRNCSCETAWCLPRSSTQNQHGGNSGKADSRLVTNGDRS